MYDQSFIVRDILTLGLTALSWILIAYIILSWLELWRQMSPRSAPRISTANPIVRFIERVAHTVLSPIRRVVEPYQRGYGIDFSPFIAFLLIGLLRSWVSRLTF